VLAALLIAFSLAHAAPATKTLTVSDSGKTVTIAANQKLQIKLEECGSCGYRWSTTVKPDPKVLTRRPQGHSNPPACSAPPCPVGGSTTTLFRYEGKADGTTTLRLGYVGPGKSKPSKTFRLVVRVR
jgi:predicted secreted protein